MNTTTCVLRPLVSAAGRKGDAPVDVTANLKSIKVAGPRPIDFWIGAIIRRQFKSAWFLGTVAEVTTDEDQTLFRVFFKDGDTQDLDRSELMKHVIYHPRLDDEFFKPDSLPELDENVLFSWGQQPRLGMVIATNAREKQAITVRMWKPSSKAKSWATARYRLAPGDEDLHLIEPYRILAREILFTVDGLLTPASRRTFQSLVKGRKLKLTSKVSNASKTTRPTTTTRSRTRSRSKKASSSRATHHRVSPVSSRRTTPEPHPRYPLRSRQKLP